MPDLSWTMELVSAAAGDCGGIGGGGRGSPKDVSRQLESDLFLLLSTCGNGSGGGGGGGGEGRGSRQRVQPPTKVGPQPEEGARIGGAVAGLPEVLSHLRGRMIAAVHVLTRLRGDVPFVETPERLRSYLETDCEGLLTNLADKWWVEGGREDRGGWRWGRQS